MATNPTPKDWHPADVKAALHRQGITLRSIAKANGYNDIDCLRPVLTRPYPKAERLVSEKIGVLPQTIWPSRYNNDGSPKSGRGERGIGRYKAKCSKPNDSGIGNDNSGG